MLNEYLEDILDPNGSMGEQFLLKAYHESKEVYAHYNELIITDICEEKDLQDFARLMRKARINSFILVDQSEILMNALYFFLSNGYIISEPTTITNCEPPKFEKLRGLKLVLNDVPGIGQK